jgi:FkbM family methyltransferase
MEDGIVTRWLTREDISHKLVSYAQNAEDVLLARVFGANHAGLYIDVGANDPVFHSVTKLLYGRGWRGVNIEPTPSLHARLAADRPEDVNLNVGISHGEDTLNFYEVAPPLHGWSTFVKSLAEHYRQTEGVESVPRRIPVITLNRVFDQYIGDRTVDVLKIDAEGFERQVLSSIDLGRHRPRVILIEASWIDQWEPIIDRAGYTLAAFDGINRYYVRDEDPGLLPAFAAPVNNLDNYISHEVVRLIEQIEAAQAAQPVAPEPEPVAPESPPVAPEPPPITLIPQPIAPMPRPDVELLGPTILSFALKLRDAAHRNPGVASVVKRLLRLVG